MRLTKNEKSTLTLLMQNSRISDTEIASKLNISSQAVGKIRRKLESTIIDSFSVNLNYAKLGIQAFAIAFTKITKEGWEKGELEIEQYLLNNPHIISVFRVPKGRCTHILFFGFKDIAELDDFFNSLKYTKELHRFIETQDLYTFSHHSLIKNSPIQLFQKTIDNMGNKKVNLKFSEIKNFKKRFM